ncbi:helix-turn-helix transcriptional regulator (plasmid) [Tistrella bauzanensis]|uniref:Helix-turn-helix transcriptional regulator n=1 Tax=Tistrella arctica TaxID=3133430 RepID=A0ABU9YP24_9PROT
MVTARPTPLIDPVQAATTGGPVVLAVRKVDAAARDTGRHVHVRGQLVGTIQGLLGVETPAGRFAAPPSHAVWLPPAAPHGLALHGPFDGWSLWVSPDACAALPRSTTMIRVSDLLRAAVLAMAEAGGRDLRRLDRIAAVILDEIAAAPAGGAPPLPLPADRRLLKVARAILDDPADDRGLDGWAALAAMSGRSLSRRFPAETGLSLSDWRRRVVAMTALERLAGGDAVTTLAIDLGYASLSAFIAMIRRETGMTPGQHRATRG